jgi:hypothetical protein
MSRVGRHLLSILSVAVLLLGGASQAVAASGSAGAPTAHDPQTAATQAASSPASASAASSSGVLDPACLSSLKAPALYRAHGAKSGSGEIAAGLASSCQRLQAQAAAKRAAAPVESPASSGSHSPAAGAKAGSSTAKPNVIEYVTIGGKVTNSAAKGLGKIEVSACPAGGGSSCMSATTDLQGGYIIYPVPVNDDYKIWFRDDTDTYAGGCYNSASSGHFTAICDNAVSVHVETSDLMSINATLPAMVHVTGRITNSAGKGIAGIRITLSSEVLRSAYTATTGVGEPGVGDAYTGTYSATVTPGASYTLQVWDGSGVYVEGYYDSAVSGHWTALFGSATTINVGSGNTTGINLTMPTGVHISGTISTTAPGGLGGNIPVDACSTTIDVCFWAPTDDEGHYTLPVLRGDKYILEAGFEGSTVAFGYYDSAASGHFTANLEEASEITVGTTDITGIDVVLPPSVQIGGTITGSSSTALSGINVSVCSKVGPPCYTMTTEMHGYYWVAVAPGYDYVVEVDDPSGTYASGFYEQGATNSYTADVNAATVLDLSGGDLTDVNVTLTAAVHITGTVTNAKANGISAIVWGCVTGTTSCWKTETDASGAYSLAVLPDHDYTVEFDDGYLIHFYRDGFYDSDAAGTSFTTDQGSASAVTVAEVDVPGINVVMPFIGDSTYHAITPARVLDTRPTGSGHTNAGLSGKFTAGTVRTFGVAGVTYVGGGSKIAIPANAIAVTGNLTVTGASAAGLIALGPTMTPTGDTTTLNFAMVSGTASENRANNVTMGLDPDGKLSAVFRSSTAGATVDLIFDITGYFLPDASGATYHALAPGRVLDTRAGTGHIGLAGKFKTKTVRTISVAGVKGLGWASALVPANAVAVTGNLTVTNATSDGFLAIGPTVSSSPSTSTLNTRKGRNTANGVTVALKSGKVQAVWVGAAGSSADVLLDITGFFTADATGMLFYPIAPYRVLDSSTNLGLTGPFATGTAQTLPVGGSGGAGGVPSDAKGIAGNFTVFGPSTNGYAFIAPSISGSPSSSTVNATASYAVANGFDVSLGSGNVMLIWVGNAGGSTANLQLDINGYWK